MHATTLPSSPQTLPIHALEAGAVDALRSGNRLILRAPTGSGKSTQVPRWLLRHGLLGTDGSAVVLQPRRLAARLLAHRVASEEGEPVGRRIGFRVRFENAVSSATRVTFVTEGILLRQMVADPALPGIQILVFDEFHERHLYTDITLGWALHLQETLRPDLRIIVMSATLATDELRRFLHPATVLESEGRTFPVDITYLPRAPDWDRNPVWDVAAQATADLLRSEPAGNALVFMPGAYEISRTLAALGHQLHGLDVDLHALHGELPAAQQDAAVAPGGRRKVIVATNVAETSVTIEGVRIVIDSGLARIARFDPHRGINTLLVERISHASADQRAGRAGRTAPGRCLRLWTEREHQDRRPFDLPEVRRLDLAEVVLTLKRAGISTVQDFRWLDPPDPRSLARAEELLADLGAIEAPGGPITATGTRILAFPVHPRYGRMLLEASRLGCVRAVCLAAALTQARSLLLRSVDRATSERRDDLFGGERDSDFAVLMLALSFAQRENFNPTACQRAGIHAQTARQVAQLWEQFLDIARAEGLDTSQRRSDGSALRRCILAGFADQVARRLDRGTLRCAIVHGRRGVLSRDAAPQDAELLVVAEAGEIGRSSGDVEVVLSLASRIEPEWLQELFPGAVSRGVDTVWDPAIRRVVARDTLRYHDLVLSATDRDDVPHGPAAAVLAREVVAGRIPLPGWDDQVEQWLVRVDCLRRWMPELGIPEFTEDDRLLLIEQACYGATGAKELADRPVLETVRSWLAPETRPLVDKFCPDRLELPSGRRARITYDRRDPPTLASRLHDFYGLDGSLTVAAGRIRIRLQLLAPNGRPVQVTDNLSGFWRDTYPTIRNELARRYPRHEWR